MDTMDGVELESDEQVHVEFFNFLSVVDVVSLNPVRWLVQLTGHTPNITSPKEPLQRLRSFLNDLVNQSHHRCTECGNWSRSRHTTV